VSGPAAPDPFAVPSGPPPPPPPAPPPLPPPGPAAGPPGWPMPGSPMPGSPMPGSPVAGTPEAGIPTPAAARWGVPEYDEPQPYHRILRTRNYRAWRPVVGLLVMLVTFGVMSVGVTLAALLPLLLSGRFDATGDQSELVGALVSDPLGLLAVNLSLAALIPAAILGLLAGHQLRPGWLHSVVGRMRWRFLAACLLLEVVITVVVLPLSALVAPDSDVVPTAIDPISFTAWLPFVAVILLTTPLQAAGEEYGFRGYGLQVLGAWVRSPWFGILVTALLFAAAHGGQSLPLFVDRFAFGVVAGLLTVRTGGLEAAIAFHVVNNMVILLLASATGQLEPSLTVSEAPWSVVVVDIAGMAVFTVAALALARRMGLQTRTAVAERPPPRPWPGLVAPAVPG
jgi:uncharacterized protein